MSKVFKIFTARGDIVEIGHQYKDGGIVRKILPVIGDPNLGFPAGYEAIFDNRNSVYIFDAVEVWRDNHSEEQSRGNPDHQ